MFRRTDTRIDPRTGEVTQVSYYTDNPHGPSAFGQMPNATVYHPPPPAHVVYVPVHVARRYPAPPGTFFFS